MLSDIVTIVLLLVFAAVFWIIPKTRSANGNWMIALKTFPLGFIALILSDKLLGKSNLDFCWLPNFDWCCSRLALDFF